MRLPDHDIEVVRLVDGDHIPGQRRRCHMPMLPPESHEQTQKPPNLVGVF
jgi:hypothetical protein